MGGGNDVRKFHLVDWNMVCSSIRQCGLGISHGPLFASKCPFTPLQPNVPH